MQEWTADNLARFEAMIYQHFDGEITREEASAVLLELQGIGIDMAEAGFIEEQARKVMELYEQPCSTSRERHPSKARPSNEVRVK
jgi:hypothetical protein